MHSFWPLIPIAALLIAGGGGLYAGSELRHTQERLAAAGQERVEVATATLRATMRGAVADITYLAALPDLLPVVGQAARRPLGRWLWLLPLAILLLLAWLLSAWLSPPWRGLFGGGLGRLRHKRGLSVGGGHSQRRIPARDERRQNRLCLPGRGGDFVDLAFHCRLAQIGRAHV